MAKRFFEIGDGEDDVSAADNEKYLMSELDRLKMTAWFLRNFKSHAKQNNVEISTGAILYLVTGSILTRH